MVELVECLKRMNPFFLVPSLREFTSACLVHTIFISASKWPIAGIGLLSGVIPAVQVLSFCCGELLGQATQFSGEAPLDS